MRDTRGKCLSLRRVFEFVAIAFDQLKYEFASRIAAFALIGFIFIVVYAGVFDDLARLASAYPASIAIGAAFAFSLVHQFVVYSIASPVNAALRGFSASAGIDGRESLALQRSWFVLKSWHVPLLEILAFMPLVAHRDGSALLVSLLVAYCLLAWPLAASIAFGMKRPFAKERDDRSSPLYKTIRGSRLGLSRVGGSLAESADAVLSIIVALAIEIAGARDLLGHRSAARAASGEELRAWSFVFLFGLMIVAQGALAQGYKVRRGYYRLLPVSYARYLAHAFSPLYIAFVLSQAPVITCMAALYPARLPMNLLCLVAFIFVPSALSERRQANKPAMGTLLFFSCAIASVLCIAVPWLGAILLAASLPIAALSGRRHFLFDEVLE